MENRLLDTKKLRLARVKYYDMENNGAELSTHDAYAFLYQIGKDQYVNLFDPTEELPVLDRTCYSNVTSTGIEYGNKLIHVCGDLKDGPCYVIEKLFVSEMFKKDQITLDELREYILSSSKFFVDRLQIIQGMKIPYYKKSRFISTVLSDEFSMARLKQYFQSHGRSIQYKK